MHNTPNNALLRLPQVLSRSFPSAAAHGGRAAKAAAIRNPSNSTAHDGVESGGYCRASGKAHRRNGGKMRSSFLPRLFVRHTRMCWAWAFRQGQALSGRFAGLEPDACTPAMNPPRATDGLRRGLGQKEVRSSKIQRQQHKKAFFASRGFPAYRHAADTMHTSLPRLTLHRIFPIHTALPHLGVQMPAPSCALCRPCLASDTDYTACA